MFAFFAIALVIALFSSLIVGNYSDVVFYDFNSDKLNRLRFLFIQVR